MTGLTSRSRLAAAASPLAICLAFASSAAYAQDTTPPPTTDPSAAVQTGQEVPADEGATQAKPEDSPIVVTGFRASLQNAVNTKKRADQIVESVSAEDIGKLPDASIAESISRLPGVASQRIAGSGRTSYLSIRGFAPDYSTTLLNGREQTSTGDNRAVEYDQYPSEVVSQVNVYKSPMASIIGQGIAGTVDLRTIRPLEYGKQVISFGGRGVYIDNGKINDGSKEFGYRLNGVYVDQFADGKVGVSLAASWNDEPYSLEEFESWGYPTIGPNGGPPAVIGGTKSYVTSSQLKRFGLQGTLEFKPTDQITSTVDGFYSDFKDDQIKRGMEVPLYWSSAVLEPGFTVNDGLVTNGTFSNVHGIPRNVAWQRDAKLYSFGWNNRYDNDDGWHGVLDLSYSKTKRNEWIFEVWSTTGGVPDVMDFESGGHGTSFTHDLDYSDPNLVVLSDPGGWGGTGYSNNRIVHDRIWQYRGEIGKDLNTSIFSRGVFGVNFTNHDKSLTPDEAFIRLPNGAASAQVPTDLLKDPTDLDFLGLGPVLAFDPFDLLDAGVITLVSGNTNPDVQLKAYDVHENLWTLYTQWDIRADLGSAELTGNVGVQAVHTDQSAGGFIAQNGEITPTTGGAKYWDVMPSLNLSARFPSDWVIRLGLAREVMRPRMDDMRSSTRVQVDNGSIADPELHTVHGDTGQPELRPFRANAADLSFEKYFGIKGYVALQLFYKHFNTFVVNQALPGVPFDFTGLPLPEPFQTTDPTDLFTYVPPENIQNGIIYQPYNVKGGNLYGAELAGTLPIGEFIGALDGFGLTGGAGWTKSKIHISPGAPPSDLPGYSKWVVNGTAYFEKYGFSARVSGRYRSSFIGEVSGFGANRVLRRSKPETVWDAQIGYEFQPTSALAGLSLYLQGQNLTNEPFVTFGSAENQIINYQEFGRRFMLGATYKFGQHAAPPPPPLPPPAPPAPPPPATQTCADGSVILATEACPAPPPPPPPPPPAPERG
jgi:iron complex outermembrane recepter protein